MLNPEPDYVDLLTNQLVGQAQNTPDLAAELTDVVVPDNPPTNVVRAARWARGLNRYVPPSVDTTTTLTRGWPKLINQYGRNGGKRSIDQSLTPHLW